jgi:hypothetical protein
MTTMVHYAQHCKAIHLINHGASCLQVGDFSTAIDSLSTALRAATMVFHSSSSCCEDDLQKFSLDSFVVTNAALHEEIGSDDEDYIYNRPIVIPPIPAIIHSESPASKVAVISIMIFNLALAHHLHGNADPDPCSSVLRFAKAAKLYELGFEVQGTQDDGSNFYSMAVLNNLGQVFRAVNEEEKASRCFSHLLSTLMFLMEIHGGNDHSVACVDGFSRTTSHLVLKEKEATAAAACLKAITHFCTNDLVIGCVSIPK